MRLRDTFGTASSEKEKQGNNKFLNGEVLERSVPKKKTFFVQAEDGIRDWSVTGVQTCALPILGRCRNEKWAV